MLVLLPLVYGQTAILNHPGIGERLNGTEAIIRISLVDLGSITGIKRIMSTMALLVDTTIVKIAQ